MDITILALGVLTVTLAAVTFHAWRLGNERRDITLLGTLSGLFGLGALASVLT